MEPPKNPTNAEKIEDLATRLFNAYGELNNRPHAYSVERRHIQLYSSEAHAIDRIGAASDINMTALSVQLGLTKGAISKMVRKLEGMGLIRRYQYMTNRKEVYLMLTPLGEKVRVDHNLFHESTNGGLRDFMAGLNPAQMELITEFLSRYQHQIHTMQQYSESLFSEHSKEE